MLEHLMLPMHLVVEEEQDIFLDIILHPHLVQVLLLLQVIQMEEIIGDKVEMALTLLV